MILYRCDRCGSLDLVTAYNVDWEPIDRRPVTMGQARHYELCFNCIGDLRAFVTDARQHGAS